jgi:prevent-host-death family protein
MAETPEPLTFRTGQHIMTIVRPTHLPAAEFKAHCLELMDRVRTKRMEITVTKYGKPVAKLVPLDDEAPELFGFLSGSVTYNGDIVSGTGEVWNAESDN